MDVMILFVQDLDQWNVESSAQASTYVLPPAQTESTDPISNDRANKSICRSFPRDPRMAGIMRQDCETIHARFSEAISCD